jgi:hypothetical protein
VVDGLQTVQKMRGVVSSLQKKLVGQETQRQVLSQQLQDNAHSLTTLQAQISTCGDKTSLGYQVVDISSCIFLII